MYSHGNAIGSHQAKYQQTKCHTKGDVPLWDTMWFLTMMRIYPCLCLSLSVCLPLSVIPYLCLHYVCLHPCLISIYLCLCLPQSLSQTAYLCHSLSLSYCPYLSVSDSLLCLGLYVSVSVTLCLCLHLFFSTSLSLYFFLPVNCLHLSV